jgi:hypothetical protein
MQIKDQVSRRGTWLVKGSGFGSLVLFSSPCDLEHIVDYFKIQFPCFSIQKNNIFTSNSS